MSARYATITIFDCLDQVVIACSIREVPDPPLVAEPWRDAATIVLQGSGVTNVHDWLRDALVAVLEAT